MRAEAIKIRLDATITLIDRLAKNGIWLVRDDAGDFHLVPLPDT